MSDMPSPSLPAIDPAALDRVRWFEIDNDARDALRRVERSISHANAVYQTPGEDPAVGLLHLANARVHMAEVRRALDQLVPMMDRAVKATMTKKEVP